jgi:hypothetical protein
MRYYFIATILIVTTGLFGQVNQITEAYLPSGSVDVGSKTKDLPGNRLLIAIYGTIKYPAPARAYGIEAIVRIDYTILKDGILRVDTTRTTTVLPEDESKIINVIAYGTNGGQSYRTPKKESKRHQKYLRRQTEGKAILEAETVRVFTNLPLHRPALSGQTPIERSYIRFINFKLE